jgi:hypothetical protein
MQLANLFDSLLTKPGLYISGRSISQAAAFMQGYMAGQYELGVDHEKDIYNGFQRWVEKRYKIRTTQSWQAIVTFMSNDEAGAFELTRELWKEYKTQIKPVA